MVIMVDMVGYGSATMEQSRFCHGVGVYIQNVRMSR